MNERRRTIGSDLSLRDFPSSPPMPSPCTGRRSSVRCTACKRRVRWRASISAGYNPGMSLRGVDQYPRGTRTTEILHAHSTRIDFQGETPCSQGFGELSKRDHGDQLERCDERRRRRPSLDDTVRLSRPGGGGSCHNLDLTPTLTRPRRLVPHPMAFKSIRRMGSLRRHEL